MNELRTQSSDAINITNAMNYVAACARSAWAKDRFDMQLTPSKQQVHLDVVVQSWGNSSGMQTSLLPCLIAVNGDQHLLAITQFAQCNPTVYAQITAREQFNGQTILDKWVRPSVSTVVVRFSPQQGVLIQHTHEALKTSVYEALVVQSRLNCRPSTKRLRQAMRRIKNGFGPREICVNCY